jgi:hypothetical protein
MCKMKNKSTKLEGFIKGLHNHIVNDRTFRKKTNGKTEVQIQTEIRPVIVDYLKRWYQNEGYVDFERKAHNSFYWEGQEGRNKDPRNSAFGAFNYPDFIIKEPYRVAVEYKQSPNGSIVKHGIGQSILHTMAGDHDFVYFLFRDQSDDHRINESLNNDKKECIEKDIVDVLWRDFNVKVAVVK